MFRNTAIFLGMLVAIAGTTAFAASVDCSNVSQFKEIDKKQLTTLLKKQQVFVVDVNSADSYGSHHIPTAINYGAYKSDADFAAALPQDPNALVVAYCGGLQCTAWEKAATAACKANHLNVRHFKPGITGWMAGNQTYFDGADRKTSSAAKPAAAPGATTN